jgi:hypothetical protein
VQMSDFCHVSSLHQQMPNIYKLPLSWLEMLWTGICPLSWALKEFL